MSLNNVIHVIVSYVLYMYYIIYNFTIHGIFYMKCININNFKLFTGKYG